MKKLFLLLPCLFVALNLFAQQSKDVLLTIDGNPVYADEFRRVFSKNLSLIDEDQRNVDEYLDLFIDYKLKVLEAENLKLDTLPTFTGEYNIYKKQLARKFINQSEVSNQLLEEAYARLQNEVNASHILFTVAKNATPKDTLVAYNKAITVRDEILNTQLSFSEAAKKYSQDPSAQANEGNLGWFSVFSMVYPFESGAYNTKIEDISMPVRTKFGYHLIRTNALRKNEGEVTVAHIMLEDKEESKNKIDKLYQQLQEGANFSDLAKQYSADKNTAINGGKLNGFKKGMLNSEKFEEAAFSLQKVGEISKPVKTKYGWHLIQLIKKDTIGSLEQEKFQLEKKIKQDSRAQLIASQVLEHIKSLYTLKEDDATLSFFKNNISKNITKESWDISELKNIPEKNLITIKSEGLTYKDFAKYINRRQKQSSNYKSTQEAIVAYYEDFKNNFYKDYHREHLEEVDREYAHVIEEYRNGLLLFDLMEKKVWNAAKNDTVALKKYYNKHQEEFKTITSINATIASAADKTLMKSVRKALKKNEVEEVKESYEKVIFNSGDFLTTASALPTKFKVKKGVSKLYNHNRMFVVVKVNEIEPAKTMTFEEAQGQVISSYQKQLEENWINSLKEQHQIEVNKTTLSKLKKEFE